MRWQRLAFVLLLIGAACSATRLTAQDTPASFPRVPPTEPRDALATFQLPAGFRLDLLAAEPLVEDPVALEYDENGLAYVVEMRDYPYTDKGSDKPFVERTTDQPLGRVRILEDTDGDGDFDRSDIFAEDLSWPTGVAVWKGGVLVTATPDVWYLKDTDGDRRADVRRRVFVGFRKFNVQAVVNNPRWGLDHGLYVAGGSNGGSIRPGAAPDAPPVELGAHDFRLDPTDESLQILAGGARFGNAFNDDGERFVCNIRNPIQHVVLPLHYLERNPRLAARAPLFDVAQSGDTLPVFRISPPEPWREFRARRWVLEANQANPRSETAGAGYFTSASGVTVYRGGAYPEEFRGNVFVGEVAGNLVHRQRIEPNGVTYTAARADEGREFLASTDNWFRPVNFTNAPDGTLHIVDMYRETIEHPWSIPDDIKALLDLESGRDRGRLYRLARVDFQPPPPPKLGSATTAELVATLASPHGWQRDTAHRLLFERQDIAAVDPLRQLLRESHNHNARLHALWSLHGLTSKDGAPALDDQTLETVIATDTGIVKAHAIRIAESRINDSQELFLATLGAASDLDPRVRMQVAFSLGESSGAAVEDALARLLIGDAHDAWLRTAVISSCNQRGPQVLERTLYGTGKLAVVSSAVPQAVRELAATCIEDDVRKSVEVVCELLSRVPESDHNAGLVSSALVGLGEGVARTGKRLSEFASGDSDGARWLAAALDRASETAIRADKPDHEREQAVRLLSHVEFGRARAPLSALLDARESRGVQLAALQGLASFAELEVAAILIERYPQLTPGLRTEAALALLAREERLLPLLNAVHDGIVPASQTPPARRKALLGHAREDIRAAAQVAFGAEAASSRAEVVNRYRAALSLAAAPERGLVVYRRECKACHKLRDEGFDVGPNLASIVHRTPEELLLHVFDPNREVAPQFQVYAANLVDGRSTMGALADETSTSLTLKRAEGVQESLLREQIEELSGTGMSLMPEGFEKTISLQDMADLIACLLEKRVPFAAPPEKSP